MYAESVGTIEQPEKAKGAIRGAIELCERTGLLNPLPDFFWLPGHGIVPASVAALSIHGIDPTVSGLGFHLGERVEAIGLEDQVSGGLALEADEEVRHVIVRLAIMKVWDGKAEPRVLHKGIDERVGIDDIRGGLLPLPRIRDHIAQMAMDITRTSIHQHLYDHYHTTEWAA